jgi:hypothetical protein
MRKDDLFLASSIGLILGLVIGLFVTNYKLFEIELKINLIEFTIGCGTAFLAYYLATTIQSFKNNSLSLVNYLQPKVNLINTDWESFKNVNLIFQNDLEVRVLSKYSKSFYLGINNLKIAYRTFGLSLSNLELYENKFELIEIYLQTLPKQNNRIELVWDSLKYDALVKDMQIQFFILIRELYDNL